MDDKLQSGRWPDVIERIRARTPARVLADRSGAAYRTGTQLELRHAHAAARDAVRAELDVERDLGPDFVQQWKLLSVSTMAASKDEYLRRPDLAVVWMKTRETNWWSSARPMRTCRLSSV